ncbi:MAG: GNAT family N-acetyltransferase [bacterium]|nr:GNAT family N-acetyltransferase [bacterium]
MSICAGGSSTAFRVTLSEEMLSSAERAVFGGWLTKHGLDDAVWEVFAAALQASSPWTQPTVVRAFDGDRLVGAAFVVRCRHWAGALFSHPILYKPVDFVGLTSFIWIRVGFCAETLANPGFVADGCDEDGIIRAMIDHLCRNAYGVMVPDWAENHHLHEDGWTFPYVHDGVVDLAGMAEAQDYVRQHNNIKRKIKHFQNKGGEIDVIHGALDEETLETVRHCVRETVKCSIIRSPFQDIFLDALARTCMCASDRMVHFVARMNGEVLGYHSFVRSGRGLRMIHGAFDRQRPTTHHSYENLIIATVDYGIRHGLDKIHFGPVLNETKRRMMNACGETSFYFHSRTPIIRLFFPRLFPFTNMQCKELLAFGRQG